MRRVIRRVADETTVRPFVIAGILVAAYVLMVLPTLGQSLLESHAFRQTQTAYTALLFAESGIDLLRPPLPVLGPPGIIPQEFPVFQAVGSVLMSSGVPSDQAMRGTGLAAFVLSAILLFLLARRVLNDVAALVALSAFLLNPHAWVYGRTSLIEYLATAGGLAFMLFATRWMDRGRLADWLLALAGGLLVALVKITTAPIFLLPVLAWRMSSGRLAFRSVGVWSLIAAASAVGLAWSQYADSVRAANPATAFLAAQNSVDWFFGSVLQRLDPSAWRVPLAVMLALTGSGLVVWGVAATQFAHRHPHQRGFLVGVLLSIVVPPVVLFNLYSAHDYYYAALAPPVALAIGMGAQRLLLRPRSRHRRLMLVGLIGAWLATIVGMTSTWSVIYGTPREEARLRETVRFIREHSEPDDWIVIEGLGWNSAFLYYAHRRGFADPGSENLLQPGELDTDAILSDPIYGPFFTCDSQGNCSVSDSR